MRPTRRRFVQGVAAVAARAAVGGPIGCASEGGEAVAATFDPRADGAVVAVWSQRAGAGLVELQTAAGASVGNYELVLTPSAGNTSHLRLEGLTPATGYRYRFVPPGGVKTPWHGFVTAPADEQAAPLRLAFWADLDTDPQFDSRIFEALVASEPAFHVSLGDWPYADNPPGAVTLDEYRARHREARLDARVQPLVERAPIYAIWDDHDVRNNWDGHFRELEAERIAAGVRAWDEWFPTPARPDPAGRYRSWRWGSLVELFLLDLRSFRSANAAPDGSDKTMLGARQRDWLRASLAASTAPFKLVFTSVPLDFGGDNDCWSLFRTERDALLGGIVDGGIDGVLFLTADQHFFAAHHHAVGIKEFQVGPLARGIGEPVGDAPEVVARALVYNYGEIEITAAPSPALVFRCRGAEGELVYEERLAPGRGVLRVDAADGSRRAFRVEGAHRFVGVTPAELPYAVPGRYQLIDDDGIVVASGELASGETLSLVWA